MKSQIRIKRAGYLFMIISILLGISAVNTGNNLLYIVVSFMLSLMLISGFMARYNLRGLSIRLIQTSEVFAEKPASFRIVVENGKRFPSFILIIASEEAEGREVFLYVKDRKEGSMYIKFPRRGYYRNIILSISSEFPLGMFERKRSISVPIEVVVFPKPKRVEIPASLLDSKYGYSFKVKDWGFEDIRDIKDYRGEPVRYIHWKASAKRDSLVVKEMEGDRAGSVIVNVDLIEGDKEERVSKAAFLVLFFMDKGIPVGLKYGDKLIEPDMGYIHRRKLLKELALM